MLGSDEIDVKEYVYLGRMGKMCLDMDAEI